MLKYLSEKFKENEFTCSGKNTEKNLHFSVEVKLGESKINQKTKEQAHKDIKCYMKHIDSLDLSQIPYWKWLIIFQKRFMENFKELFEY